ncbi:MAG: PEGA domain-containing protein [Myxococcales bacterium]|nr:PEGA domain-containing protein [Myxococcales bacterium]MCB9523292.1 PEGA domain-containing protein [Myxococcales bacterium]
MPAFRFTVVLALGLCLAWPVGARPRKGRLLVDTGVPGATIEVDGQVIGESPMRLPFVVRAGEHEVRVTKPGHAPYTATVSVRGGVDRRVQAALPPVAAVLTVQTDPGGARVLLDGRMLGLAPLTVEVPPGRGLLEVVADGYGRHREPLLLGLGEITARQVHLVAAAPQPVTPAAEPWYRSGWVWAAVGAVAAGAVVTAVVVNASADDQRPPPTHSLVFEPTR